MSEPEQAASDPFERRNEQKNTKGNRISKEERGRKRTHQSLARRRIRSRDSAFGVPRFFGDPRFFPAPPTFCTPGPCRGPNPDVGGGATARHEGGGGGGSCWGTVGRGGGAPPTPSPPQSTSSTTAAASVSSVGSFTCQDPCQMESKLVDPACPAAGVTARRARGGRADWALSRGADNEGKTS